MSPYEMEHFIIGKKEAERVSWEQARTIVYAIFQSQSRKSLDPKKVWPLPWDAETHKAEAPTEKEMDEFRELSDKFSKIIYGED